MDNRDKIVLNREEYPGNRKTTTTPVVQKPKPKKLVTAKRVKKPFIQRFKNAFLDGEPAHEVGNYVLYEVVIPAAKSTIADLIEGTIDMVLFGGSGRAARSRSSYLARDRGRSYVPYNSMHDRGTNVSGSRSRYTRAATPERDRARSNDVSDILFPSRADAELVLSELAESISKYGAVSMSDFYDMAGISTPYTAQKWGWTDISGSSIVRVREGWIVDLPNPIAID